MKSILTLLSLSFVALARIAAGAEAPPNVVVILCDDLGYGDVGCLNPQGKIPTPRLDALAAAGLSFTDAHSGSSVCTPTRYGLLTGRYAWRSRLQSGVLGGLSPRLIEPGRLTLASYLKQHAYSTACVGKWHLGLGWELWPGQSVTELGIESPVQAHSVDFSKPFTDGPLAVGFDEYFGISASLDMVPYTFLRNDRVDAPPTVDKSFAMMLGRPDRMTRLGPAAADFEAEQVLPSFTREAIRIIREHASGAADGRPLFLYVPLAAPHTPIAPSAEWQGKSGLNPYADFVMQTDWSIGQIIDELDAGGLRDNTLLVVTSDNGCSPEAKFDELQARGHNPSYHFRGMKADVFDGGHRVPFFVRWPGHVRAGSTSEQLVCLTDLFATVADVLGEQLPPDAAEDSFSFRTALDGSPGLSPRTAIVHHSINGSFVIREKNWKLALCPDSGGWSQPRPGSPQSKNLPPAQLFDLSTDIGETRNLAGEQPDVVARLITLMQRYVEDGRSTPGAPQSNAVGIQLWKARRIP